MRKMLALTFTLIVFVLLNSGRVYAAENSALPSAELKSNLSIREDDSRTKILRAFLQKYNSPLADSARNFIKNADFYNLDWRLVASISGVESTFGQFIPYNSYNGWGWGVYGNNVIYFSSWKEGIETISKGLKENYIDKGAANIYQIGRIYAESPTWAYKVNYFMEKIDEFKSQNEVNSLSLSL